MTTATEFAFLERHDHDGSVLAIAHRGGAGEWPENTLPAYENAIALGYRFLETDVHASADGHLFAFHDEHLGRVSTTNAYLADLTAHELDQVEVSGYRIPRLEALVSAWPNARFVIDPKVDAAVEPLARLIAERNLVDRVCIGSFSDRRLTFLRERLGPALCTSMGPKETARLFACTKGLPLRREFAPCAQLPKGYLGLVDFTRQRFIEAARDLGVEVHFWTIDDPAAMTELLDAGAGGIITDEPAILKQVLVDRGDWATTAPETRLETNEAANDEDE